MKESPIKDLKGLKTVKQQLEARAKQATEQEAARKAAAAKARAEKDFFALAVGPIKPLPAKHLPGHRAYITIKDSCKMPLSADSFSSRTIEAGALVGINGRVLATGAGLPGGFVTRNGATRTVSTGLMPWASRIGTWQTNHPTTPKINVPFGECLVVVEAPTGVGLRYLADRHPACAPRDKKSWRVSMPPKGNHVF